MKRRFISLSAALPALLLIVVPSPVFAQQAPDVSVGQRARITIHEQSPDLEGFPRRQIVRGTLLTVTADSVSLGIHPGAAPLALSWPAVERIEISGGVRSRAGSAVRRGASMAAVGAFELFLLNKWSDDPVFDEDWQAAALGAGAGALIGIIIGALRPQEIWNRVR